MMRLQFDSLPIGEITGVVAHLRSDPTARIVRTSLKDVKFEGTWPAQDADFWIQTLEQEGYVVDMSGLIRAP